MYKPFLILIALQHLLLTQTGAYENDQSVFTPGICTTGPVLTASDAAKYIGAGKTQVSLGNTPLYRRSRPCNPMTGCGPWEQITNMGESEARIVADLARNRFVIWIIRTPGDIHTKVMEIPWSTKSQTGGEVSTFNATEFLNKAYATTTGKMYLRQNCLKVDFITSDQQWEYAAYWTLRPGFRKY